MRSNNLNLLLQVCEYTSQMHLLLPKTSRLFAIRPYCEELKYAAPVLPSFMRVMAVSICVREFARTHNFCDVTNNGFAFILRQADVMLVHATDLILRRRKALSSGFPVPGQHLCVFQCLVACVKIFIREGELRLGIPGSGGLLSVRVGRLRKHQRRNKAEEKTVAGQKTELARSR